MVGGNPARLNEAGNTMMTCATDVQESDTALGGYRSFASSALGRADGSSVAAAFDDAVSELLRATGRLGSTLATDGHYLQQSSRQLDHATDDAGGGGGGGGGGGRPPGTGVPR